MLERRDFLLAERGADRDREMASGIQHNAAALVARLQATGTSGVRAALGGSPVAYGSLRAAKCILTRRDCDVNSLTRRGTKSRSGQGESLHTIGRAFGKPHNSIHGFLSQHGGIVPAARRRALLVLTAVEREDISRGLASGSSIRDIAKVLERAASTVSREVRRHGGRPEYRAQEADQQAWESALRPKRCLLAIQVKLRKVVASKLILDWSPQQISGWLKIQYPADESMRVSHETIYRSLFIQARGVLKKELLGHLRSKRRIRRSQHSH